MGSLLECSGLPRSTYCYALSHPAKQTRPELWGAVAEIFSRAPNGCGIRLETGCHKYSSYKGVVGETLENVTGRDFSAAAPWLKMGTDVTKFKQPWGKAYFAPVYDFSSKEIVARSTSTSPDMAQRLALLGRLLAKLPEGATPVLHGDMGWQYQHAAWTRRLEDARDELRHALVDDAVAHLNRIRTSKD